MKKTKKIKKNVKIKKEIPDEIKIIFGKFYVYSLIIVIILLLFPLILKSTSVGFLVLIFLLLLCFYLGILKNTFKKKGKFSSILLVFMVFLTFFAFSLALLKILGLT